MNNTINNNVNFQAKLDIRRIAKNKARWEKIAHEFELQTKRIPNDTFCLAENASENSLLFVRTKNDRPLGTAYAQTMQAPLFHKLLKLEDSVLVTKLKKLYNLQRKKDELFYSFSEVDKKYIDRQNVPVKAEINFATAWDAADDALIERHLKKDKFLYENREYLKYDSANLPE